MNVRLISTDPDTIGEPGHDLVHCYDWRLHDTLCGLDVMTCIQNGLYEFAETQRNGVAAITCPYCREQIKYIKNLH